MKRCRKCGVEKPESAFYAMRSSSDGLTRTCSRCLADYQLNRYSRRLKVEIALPTKKRCKKCGVTQSSDQFYRHASRPDGLSYICKKCTTLKNAAEKKQNREKFQLRNLLYRSSEHGKEVNERSLARQREKNKVRSLLRNATKDGKLGKPGWCCMCGAVSGSIHGHHFDYKYPFKVIWCCTECHGILHRKHYTGKEWSNG